MSGSIVQSGPVVPGHVGVFVQNGVMQDSGPGYNGIVSELGIQNSGGLAIGVNSGPVTGPYIQFGVIANANGSVTLSAAGFGGAPDATMYLELNGVTYPFNPSASGNVTGPTGVVANSIAVFNGTSGEIIKAGTLGVFIGTLDVTGTVNLVGTLNLAGVSFVTGTLDVAGPMFVTGTTELAGPLEVTGMLTMAGGAYLTDGLTADVGVFSGVVTAANGTAGSQVVNVSQFPTVTAVGQLGFTLPNGVIMNAGIGTSGASGIVAITWEVPYQIASPVSVVASEVGGSTGGFTVGCTNATKTNGTFEVTISGTGTSGYAFFYNAVGQ